MRLKSYFARNVDAALVQARQELGAEAMLVHSRKAPPEAAHLGDYEVVFAVGPGPAPPSAPPPPPPADAAGLGRLSAEVLEVRRQLERMAAAVTRSAALAALTRLPGGDLGQAATALLTAEVDPELVLDIMNSVRAAGQEDAQAVMAELARRFEVDSSLASPPEGPRLVALAGPCGSGKTTTLVKLAVEGLKARRPTLILSLDNHRVAAVEQLRAYAAVLGVAFQALESGGALAQALEENRRKDLVLIDTPGYGPAEMEDAEELAHTLAADPRIDTHLVLTASTKSADLFLAVERFERFRTAKLLFTRLDETSTFGPLFSLAARTGKPVSFLAAGQRIPEDLEPATKSRLIDLLLKEAGRAQAVSAP